MADINEENQGVNEDLGQTEMDQQQQSSSEGNNANQDDSDEGKSDAAQANAARHAAGEERRTSALRYADRNRSSTTRSNEASDRLDTGSGGLGAGGGHSAGEIM
ncbi:hypothetical protein [Aridibaculum aurantiacum]|uniref:hypothetical protein n=1 Tax=Aridibaculum aurantiacum TaxID=2810307 RepID=UPI001A97135A|nr:hypothetical protein [Aridibaculum aurantiacum]